MCATHSNWATQQLCHGVQLYYLLSRSFHFLSSTPRCFSGYTFLNGANNWNLFFLLSFTTDLYMASKTILCSIIYHVNSVYPNSQMSWHLRKSALTTGGRRLVRF